jgi:putative acetyltransferase
MITLKRTDSTNDYFQELVSRLDADLLTRYGEEQAFFDQFNSIRQINHVVVAFQNKVAVGCGAFKPYDDATVEIKRMFVDAAFRGKGVAQSVLNDLERWAATLGYKKSILETGVAQPEAIALYNKCGYDVIENFGQYAGVKSSICMGKRI